MSQDLQKCLDTNTTSTGRAKERGLSNVEHEGKLREASCGCFAQTVLARWLFLRIGPSLPDSARELSISEQQQKG